MTKPTDYELFKALVDEIRRNGSTYEAAAARGLPAPLAILTALAGEPWGDGEGPNVTVADEALTKLKPSALGPTMSMANRFLREAAVRLSILRVPHVVGAKKRCTYRVVFGRTVARFRPDFKRIIILGKDWHTEVNEDFMRGANAMAAELGVELEDRLGDRRMDGTADIARLQPPGENVLIESVGELNPDEDAIIVLNENRSDLYSQIRTLGDSRFHIVTVGTDPATVCQNYHAAGKMLGELCVAEEKSYRKSPAYSGDAGSKRIVLLFEFAWSKGRIPPDLRSSGYCSVLKRSGLFDISRILLEAQENPPYDAAAAEARSAIRTRMIDTDPSLLAAIFPKTEGLTGVAVNYADSLPHKPGVYSERLLSSDLRYLGDVNSTLRAVCGVPFRSVGRYAVRIACRRTKTTGWPEVPPMLITKAEAIRSRIISTHRVLSRLSHHDPGLDRDCFAWDKD